MALSPFKKIDAGSPKIQIPGYRPAISEIFHLVHPGGKKLFVGGSITQFPSVSFKLLPSTGAIRVLVRKSRSFSQFQWKPVYITHINLRRFIIDAIFSYFTFNLLLFASEGEEKWATKLEKKIIEMCRDVLVQARYSRRVHAITRRYCAGRFSKNM